MLNTYIKSKGLTQTIIHNNKLNEINELNWDANYDGNMANISFTSNVNGNREHFDVSLDNHDLASILNVPSVNIPLEERIKMDFNGRENIYDYKFSQIELPEIEKYDRTATTDKLSESIKPYSIQRAVETYKPNNHISSPSPNEEFVVPITIDGKTIDNYTLTPRRKHRKKKTHKTYKVYKAKRHSNKLKQTYKKTTHSRTSRSKPKSSSIFTI
jgi:hypothetical protein